MGTKSRSRALVSMTLTAFLLFFVFQNCSDAKYSALEQANQPSSSVETGGGSNGGFDGKLTYIVKGNCDSGSTTNTKSPQARLVVANDFASATLVRDNCADLVTEKQTTFAASKFSFKDQTRQTLALQGRVFTLESPSIAPRPLSIAWICSSHDGTPNSVTILEDAGSPGLYYNQNVGSDAKAAQVATDLIVAVKTETLSTRMYATAQFDPMATNIIPSIMMYMPMSGSSYASIQLATGNSMSFSADCLSLSPTPSPTPTITAAIVTPAPGTGGGGATASPTPSPSPSPSPTPMPPPPSHNWMYAGHASYSQLVTYSVKHCPVEAINPGPCANTGDKCYVIMGWYWDASMGQNMYNYFVCQ